MYCLKSSEMYVKIFHENWSKTNDGRGLRSPTPQGLWRAAPIQSLYYCTTNSDSCTINTNLG